MATGTISGIDPTDNWQLIATNTLTAAASSSFTGLSGYKTYAVLWKMSSFSASSRPILRFNGDSTSGNYASDSGYTGSAASFNLFTGIELDGDQTTAGRSGLVFVYYADKSFPKVVETIATYLQSNKSVWVSTDAVTSMIIQAVSGNMTGTVSLYGIAS